MLKPAIGAVGMLLTILIIGLIAVMTLPMLKSTSGTNLNNSSINYESAEDKANEMIDDIQKKRQEAIEYYNNQ